MNFDVHAVRRANDDPERLARQLGQLDGAKRQPGGIFVRCASPEHHDASASCSLTRGPDGTVRAKCFACGWSGDAIGYVGAVHGVPFVQALAIAAELAGVGPEAAAPTPRAARPAPVTAPPSHPLAVEVAAAWDACGRVADRGLGFGVVSDAPRCADLAELVAHLREQPEEPPGELVHGDVVAYLASRALDASTIDDLDLLRVLPADGAAPGKNQDPASAGILNSPRLPPWAARWPAMGYRLVARVYDAAGEARSLRAWRIDGGEPKRRSPGGFSSAGLVLADAGGVAMLRGDYKPARVIIAEGESDHATWAARVADADESAPAVLGIAGAGSWSQAIADRVPDGALVIIRTDLDDAGERYAVDVARTVGNRCKFARARKVAA